MGAKKQPPPTSLLSSLGLVKPLKPRKAPAAGAGAAGGAGRDGAAVEQRIQLLQSLQQTQGSRELQSAARQGDVERVRYLVKFVASCDVNFRSSASEDGVGKGACALHLAAMHNHPDVCVLLLDSGASLAATTDSGSTALHVAAKRGSKEALAVLLGRASADTVFFRDSLGNTALTYAQRAVKDKAATVQTFKRLGWSAG